MRNHSSIASGANSVILNLLKNSEGIQARHLAISRWPRVIRSLERGHDSMSTMKDSFTLYRDLDGLLDDDFDREDKSTKSYAPMQPFREDNCLMAGAEENSEEQFETASPYTEIGSPQDTLVENRAYDAERFECASRISSTQSAVLSPPLSPSFNLGLETKIGQNLCSGISKEGDLVIGHDIHSAIKFDIGDLNVQKQAQASHRRAPSTTSSGRSAKPGVPLRVRSRTSEGIIELRTGTLFTVTPGKGAGQHRRRISLGLPINTHQSQHCLSQRSPSPSTIFEQDPSASVREECELEYQHRHTFIGTASLDDFLELLELSPDYMTNKTLVSKAFVHLASTEQRFVRQSSSLATGWELVSRITPNITTGGVDYLTQAHVKLGSVTLRQFLELIPFDENGGTGSMAVVEAFCAASHLDKNTEIRSESKAKAFRAWMLSL